MLESILANIQGVICRSVRDKGWTMAWANYRILNRLMQLWYRDLVNPIVENGRQVYCGGQDNG